MHAPRANGGRPDGRGDQQLPAVLIAAAVAPCAVLVLADGLLTHARADADLGLEAVGRP